MIFFGTSSFSLHALDRLLELGIKPDSIVTVPDMPRGRKLILTPPPAKVWAERHNVPFLQFTKLDANAVEKLKTLKEHALNIFLVASYGKIIPQAVLDIPVHGSINIHPSLLPKYRGATPLQSAILADDKNTGVTLMLMDAKMDHGPIISTKKYVTSTEAWPPGLSELEYVLARDGADLAAEYIQSLENPNLKTKEVRFTVQNESFATYTKKIEKEDGLVRVYAVNNISDTNSNTKVPSNEIVGKTGWDAYLKYKALEGWPGIYFFTKKLKQPEAPEIRVTIKEAVWNSAENKLQIRRVTPEGKKEMGWKEFQNFLLS